MPKRSTFLRFLRVGCLLAVLGTSAISAKAQDSTRSDSVVRPRRWKVPLLNQSLDSLLNKALPPIDTSYIAGYYTFLHLQLLGDRRYQALRVTTSDDQLLRYRTNIPSALGIGLGYGWLGLDFVFPFTNSDRIERKGRTRQFRFNLNINTRKLWVGFQYQRIRGLYIANPEDLAPPINQEIYPQRADIQNQALILQGYYCFNFKKFSNPATFWQRERQLRSAGSPLVGMTFFGSKLKADSSMIPNVEPGIPSPAHALVNYNTARLALNVGYIHTFVIHKYWFVTASIRPGIALRATNWVTDDDKKVNFPLSIGTQSDARLVLGFNNDRYYGGAAYSLALFGGKLGELAEIRTTHGHIRLLVGTRLNLAKKR